MAEKKVIDHSSPISQEDAREIFRGASKFPMAIPLVKAFERASDPKTYRLKENEYSLEIYGGTKDKDIRASMVLRQGNKYVSLDLLNLSLEELPPLTELTSYDQIAHISAGPKRTGVWAYGEGNETTYAIVVRVQKELSLPKKETKWFFDLMSWFALISGEFCLDSSEQPRFWTGSKEKPD